MKTYTIKPLEWKGPFSLWCCILGTEYRIIPKRDLTWKVLRTIGDTTDYLPGKAQDEAAAKELAWQDWLRRITPALEECK